jgi:ribosomal protein S18 acetylase RimI-like enzyme
MILREWRDLPASAVAPLRAADLARWSEALAWDIGRAWTEIETARAGGVLPGLVAEQDGRSVGWTFYLPHGPSLQIGAFISADEDVTHAIVDELLISPEADAATEVQVFALDAAPGLVSILDRRGFATQVYRYLQLPLARADEASTRPAVGRPWCAGDAAALRRLFARAYAKAEPARPFARNGSDAEWAEYIGQLIGGGCGQLVPSASIVVPSADADRLDAAFMVTQISDRTAHLAQCAVDPAAARRGLGTAGLQALADGLRANGFTRLTLLVADDNARARRLYERAGFEETASFVSAVRNQPRRSTSAAFEAGGVSTFR